MGLCDKDSLDAYLDFWQVPLMLMYTYYVYTIINYTLVHTLLYTSLHTYIHIYILICWCSRFGHLGVVVSSGWDPGSSPRCRWERLLCPDPDMGIDLPWSFRSNFMTLHLHHLHHLHHLQSAELSVPGGLLHGQVQGTPLISRL